MLTLEQLASNVIFPHFRRCFLEKSCSSSKKFFWFGFVPAHLYILAVVIHVFAKKLQTTMYLV